MRVLRTLTIAATLALVLVLPLTAHAGGWSTVSLDSPQASYSAGQETNIGFTMLQHGQTPLGGLTPIVRLQHPGSGESLTITAVESGPRGHYVAKVVFQRAGTWQWEVNAFEGDHPMPPLEVAAAPGASPSVLAVEQHLRVPWPAALAIALAAGVAGALAYTLRLARRPA
jgi:hypothetical protein